jgi:hypothetical protein
MSLRRDCRPSRLALRRSMPCIARGVHIAGVTVAPAMECLHVPQELLNAAFPAPLFLPAFDRQDAS